MSKNQASDLPLLTASVVSAYVANNRIGSGDLGQLITSTYDALKTLGEPTQVETPSLKVDKAAIRKSITPDHLMV